MSLLLTGTWWMRAVTGMCAFTFIYSNVKAWRNTKPLCRSPGNPLRWLHRPVVPATNKLHSGDWPTVYGGNVSGGAPRVQGYGVGRGEGEASEVQAWRPSWDSEAGVGGGGFHALRDGKTLPKL
jgi:hypothetical protein